MSNTLKRAIKTVDDLRDLSESNTVIHRVHPLIKLITAIVYIAVVVSFHKYNIFGLAKMVLFPMMVFILAELSIRNCLYRLRVVMPLVCLIGILNPFFDKTQVLFFGFPVRAGILSMITLMLKGVFCVLAAYLLVATTTIEDICYALHLLHLPSVFITQVLLTYRYIGLMFREADRLMQAYRLRAPGQKGIHIKAWGSLAGQLLLRTIDRAGRVYDSMLLRGYCGEHRKTERRRPRK